VDRRISSASALRRVPPPVTLHGRIQGLP
jgi:hypothetical protein